MLATGPTFFAWNLRNVLTDREKGGRLRREETFAAMM
jgi:hypothetical protein